MVDRLIESVIIYTHLTTGGRYDYISKPAPAKKKAAPTKVDLVHAICKAVDIDSCDGLEKATGVALDKLLRAIS